MSGRVKQLAILAAAIVAAGCTREGPGAAEPQPSAAPPPPAAPANDADGEPPAPTGHGLGPALEAAGGAPHHHHGSTPPPAAPAANGAALSRIWVDVDVPSVLETPIWAMLKPMLRREASDERRCLFDLLPRVQSLFVDMHTAGEGPERFLLSARTTAASEDVAACLRTAARERVSLETGTVGGLPGLVGTLEDPTGAVALVEAAPGWWLAGFRDDVEQAMALGTPPEDDPEFVELTGPLGPSAVRCAALPGPGYVDDGPQPDDTAPEYACLVDAWPRFTGVGFGVDWRQALDLVLAVRQRTPEDAETDRECIETVWAKFAQALRTAVASSHDTWARALRGHALEETLGSVRFDAPGAFVIGQARIPGAVVLALLAGATSDE